MKPRLILFPERNERKPHLTESIERVIGRFWAKVVKSEWCWTFPTPHPDGYARLYANGKAMLAHGFSWLIHFGEIPEGMCVCHRCDNTMCVRPDHLFLGTHQENILDASKKGRLASQIGEKSSLAKLTNEQVVKIRERRSAGLTYEAIAKEFNVSKATVWLIITGRRWSHVASE